VLVMPLVLLSVADVDGGGVCGVVCCGGVAMHVAAAGVVVSVA